MKLDTLHYLDEAVNGMVNCTEGVEVWREKTEEITAHILLARFDEVFTVRCIAELRSGNHSMAFENIWPSDVSNVILDYHREVRAALELVGGKTDVGYVPTHPRRGAKPKGHDYVDKVRPELALSPLSGSIEDGDKGGEEDLEASTSVVDMRIGRE
ncbi:hypothetical protein B0A48_12936 [Cryoendolithus antarcticus]|uniref:Uncharacterized protein n=1 Tax=Cryoendolithus antarcticus TaxID=1507870 RepID=A0A1V8SQW1_9PEZI|nr:hypothetical protein B0A48_12936 [Cryoendolithus antarcticus]